MIATGGGLFSEEIHLFWEERLLILCGSCTWVQASGVRAIFWKVPWFHLQISKSLNILTYLCFCFNRASSPLIQRQFLPPKGREGSKLCASMMCTKDRAHSAHQQVCNRCQGVQASHKPLHWTWLLLDQPFVQLLSQILTSPQFPPSSSWTGRQLP